MPLTPNTRRTCTVAAICLAFTVLVAVLHWVGFVPLQEAEWFAQDLQTRLGRKTPIDSQLLLIGIDTPAYESFFSDDEVKAEPVLASMRQTFPWSRAVWARLIQKLADAGAKVIALDLVFAAQADGDDELKHVLEKYKDRVVIGYDISMTKTERGFMTQIQLPNASVLAAVGTNSPFDDSRLGFINIYADYDGILRKAVYRLTGAQAGEFVPPGTVLESMDARVLEKMGCGDRIPPGTDAHTFRYSAAPGLGFPHYALGDVMSPKLWRANFGGGAFFKDKVVFIGPTAEIFHDFHSTPFTFPSREMSGPEIHLNVINAAIHREFPRELSRPPATGVILIAGLAAVAVSLARAQPIKRLARIAVLGLGYAGLVYEVLIHLDAVSRILLVLAPLSVFTLGSVSTLTYDYVLERREKRRIRQTLERYVSRDVVKEVLDNPATFLNSLSGVRKPVAVLFCDVRDFTTRTESANEAELVKQLNEYFHEMVRLVFAHQGRLDKFIGDCVMADWGSIVSGGPAADAKNAVATALAMKRVLPKLNEQWQSRGIAPIRFGIGINHGDVILGNLGSDQKMEVSVIGDAVNVASRLEGLTKDYHLDLLLGESVARLVGDTYLLRTVDYVRVKGKLKPVEVFTVLGDGAAQTVSMPVWLARYEEGIRLYRRREFAAALAEFEECLRRQPEDFLSSLYAGHCRTFLQDPPDETWDGVVVMTKK